MILSRALYSPSLGLKLVSVWKGVILKAAIILNQGQNPVYGDFKDPMATSDQHIIRVQASSISQITKARASATHYSSDSEVPFIPGFDGVGTLEDGSSVYFLLPKNPYGAMAEYCLVDKEHYLLIPNTLSPEVAAAMAIPGMSSWAACIEQAQMVGGETILINGASGISGRLAIQIAKYLGAKKIIATARRLELFEELYALGADRCIQLTENVTKMEEELANEFKLGVHIVLDYLWGPSALSLINVVTKNSPPKMPIKLIQIGSISGATIPLSGAVLRSSCLQLMGSGLGSLSIAQMLNSVFEVLKNAPTAGFKINTQQMPLSHVASAWGATKSEVRTVLMP